MTTTPQEPGDDVQVVPSTDPDFQPAVTPDPDSQPEPDEDDSDDDSPS